MPFPNRDTQFQPGQSGNPGGRPKGRSLTAILREVLDRDQVAGQPIPDGKTVAEVLAEVIVRKALEGKYAFAREVLDRVEGKVTQPLNVEGAGLFQTVLYLPDNGRAADPDPDPDPDDPAAAGAPDGVPGD